jgi:hypothetical protein
VDAAVRFERECARHKWSPGSLRETCAHAARPTSTDCRAAADCQPPRARLQSALTGAEAEASRYRDRRVFSKGGGCGCPIQAHRDACALWLRLRWGGPRGDRDTSNAETVLLKTTTPGGALLPSTASLVQALPGDRPVLLLPTLDACLEAPEPRPSSCRRACPTASARLRVEANAPLLDVLRQTDAEIEVTLRRRSRGCLALSPRRQLGRWRRRHWLIEYETHRLA